MRLTHSYLLLGDDQPTCTTCGHPLTVRHILLDCIDLQDVRQTLLLIPVSEICLEVLTIMLLLILTNVSVVIAYYYGLLCADVPLRNYSLTHSMMSYWTTRTHLPGPYFWWCDDACFSHLLLPNHSRRLHTGTCTGHWTCLRHWVAFYLMCH